MTTPVKILHIVGPIDSVSNTQFGIETSVNLVTGFRMWGGKDANGAVTRWLALDKYARVTTLDATVGVTTPLVDLKTGTPPAPGVGRLAWDSDELVPYFHDQVDDVKQRVNKSHLAPLALNDTGSPITKGTPCALGPVSGATPTIYPVGLSNYTTGDYIVFPTRDVADASTVQCTWIGKIYGVDTSGFGANELLYLDTVAGQLTNVSGPTSVNVGRCLEVSTDGTILATGAGVGGAGTDRNPTFDSVRFDPAATVTVTPEGSVWWNGQEYTLNVATGLGATVQVGQEQLLLYYNNTGSLIPNGTVVRPAGATTVSGYMVPTPQLAKADNHATCEGTLSVATHDIANGALGFTTRFGRVRELNTAGLTPGATMWLSATTAGAFTETKPEFPNFSISLGGLLTADAAEGEIFVSVTRSQLDIFRDIHDGSFVETIKFTITSDGATVTGNLENNADNTRDLTMAFSDGLSTLDTTPADTIALTAGSDTIPQRNFIYVLQSTKALTVSTSGWPTAEHIKVADTYIQSAVGVQTDGAYVNRNWNDHVKAEGDNGHLLHIAEKLRQFEAQWASGMEGSVTVGGGTTVDFAVTSGFAYQLHRQAFPALNTATGDPVFVPNHSVTPFYRTTDLESLTADANGDAFLNTSYSIVFWGVQNKTGEPCHLMANLPSGTYSKTTPGLAVDDAQNHSVYTIPREFQGKGILISRATFVNNNGVISLYDTEDLRGKIPNATAGGGAGGVGVTTFLGLSDTDSTYAGFAGKVPVVNVGEDALEFSDLNLDNTVDGTDRTAVNKTPDSTETGLEVTDGEVPASGYASSIKWQDTVLRRSGAVSLSTPNGLAVCGKYVFVQQTVGDEIKRFNRFTSELLQSYAGDPLWGARGIVCNETLLYNVGGGVVHEINPDDLTDFDTISAGGLLGTPQRGSFATPSGDIINVADGNSIQVAVRGASTFSVTTTAIPGMTGQAYGLAVDDTETYFYVFDATAGVVRKYDFATVTLQASSPVLAGSIIQNTLEYYNGYVHIFLSGKDYVINPTDMSLAYTSSVSATGFSDVAKMYAGVMYAWTTTNRYEYQVPELTEYSTMPRRRNGEGVVSSPSVLDSNGDPVVCYDNEIVRAVPAVTAHDKTLKDDGFTSLGLAAEIPLAAGESYKFTDADFTDLGDSAGVEPRETTLLDSTTITSGSYNYVAVGEKYIAVSRNVSGAVIVDRETLAELWTTANTPAFAECVFVSERLMLRFNAAGSVTYIDVVADTADSYTASGMGVCRAFCLSVDKTLVYAIDDSDVLYSWDIEDKTLNTIGTITGLHGDATAMVCDLDGLNLWIFEGDRSTAGTAYVRKILISTFSIVISSSSFAVISGGMDSATMRGAENGVIITNPTSTTEHEVRVFKKSDLSQTHIDSGTASFFRGAFYDGTLYGIVGSNVKAFSMSSLTQKAPRHLDLTGVESSAITVPDIVGTYNMADLVRSKIYTGQLVGDRLGVSVLSVQTSLPGSPVDGGLYLILGGTTQYEDKVAEYTGALGWKFYTPGNESRVYCEADGYWYEWHIDEWQRRIEWVLKATTNDSGGGDSAIMSFDGATDYPQMVEWSSAGDLNIWRVDIFIHAETETLLGTPPIVLNAAWKYPALIVAWTDSTTDLSTINGVGSISFPVSMASGQLFAPDAVFSTPTIEIDTTTKELKINVGHTSSSAGDVRWKASVRGYVGSGHGADVTGS